jgi:hypothetical protein
MLCVQPKTWGVTACKRASELQVKVATDLDSSQSSKVARPSAYRTPSPFLCQSSDFHVGKSSGFRARTMSETEGRTHNFVFFTSLWGRAAREDTACITTLLRSTTIHKAPQVRRAAHNR